MSRLFGFLAPDASADLQRHRANFVSGAVTRVAAFVPDESGIGNRFLCGGTYVAENGDVSIAVAGRPFWLSGGASTEQTSAIVNQLASAYVDSGLDFLARLGGPFAMAIVDRRNQSVHLAVDRFGMESLAFAPQEDGIVFGTSATNVARTPGVTCGLRRQALFDYLFMHMIPAPATVYENVHKLLPATAVTWRAGKTVQHRYWQPQPGQRRSSYVELKSALFDGLRAGTLASGLDDRTGAFLSGGLDSSTVAGMLAAAGDRPAKTFTVGFGEANYDELRYARISARHFGCREFEYILQPQDIVDAFPKIAAHCDEPFGNSSAVPALFCAQLAGRNGVDHLLAGDGGDELFGGNERYSKQLVFDVYARLPAWLRRLLLDPLADTISPKNPIMPLRKFRSYVDQASIRLPDRFESWNFVFREGRGRLLDPAFAESVDLDSPLKLMRDVWDDIKTENLLDRMLYYDWKFTLADNDLRKVGSMCELAGVRVSYPMLHPDVVDLSTRVPASMKMKGLELRSFYRKSMNGYLAKQTLDKDKHGFGLPFGVWLKTHKPLERMIYGYLADLKLRKIISTPFIDNLIDEHRGGHASYYGYAIWDLAMLEAWLQTHDF